MAAESANEQNVFDALHPLSFNRSNWSSTSTRCEERSPANGLCKILPRDQMAQLPSTRLQPAVVDPWIPHIPPRTRSWHSSRGRVQVRLFLVLCSASRTGIRKISRHPACSSHSSLRTDRTWDCEQILSSLCQLSRSRPFVTRRLLAYPCSS